jgi:hypothetical protein
MRAKSWLKAIVTAIASVGVAGLLIWAFVVGRKELAQEQERERPIKAPTRVSVQEGEAVVTLDKATQSKAGIVVVSLQPMEHREQLTAYGTVLQIRGLVDLYKSYSAAKAQVEQTQALVEASRKEYERLKALRDNQNISAKVFQAAEATWRSNEASARGAQEALRASQAMARDQWGPVLFRWLVDSTPEFDRLIHSQDLLVQLTLPYGARISAPPQNALVQPGEGKPISVRLVSQSPRTDPRIQGRSFFYIAADANGALLPGMNARAFLPIGSALKGVTVPASAVVWWQGKAWIYVKKDAEHFVRREMTTDAPVPEGWFVARRELSAGSRLVVTGAQLLLSEEFRAQVQISD